MIQEKVTLLISLDFTVVYFKLVTTAATALARCSRLDEFTPQRFILPLPEEGTSMMIKGVLGNIDGLNELMNRFKLDKYALSLNLMN